MERRNNPMKRLALFLLAFMVVSVAAFPAPAQADPKKGLEPFTYKENFETNELSAWASYPLWQDTAFDPNIRPNTIVPGDPNISLVERVTPYTHVDNYAGAQKLLDMVFLEDSVIRLRPTSRPSSSPSSSSPAGRRSDGAVDFTVAALRQRLAYGDRPLRGLRPQNPGRGRPSRSTPWRSWRSSP
jgi:hypothetical protein